jgi:CheY-like chemotaxis protein
MTRTVLVVDDNQSVRESLHFLLSHKGYTSLLAASGPEAMDLARHHVIDGALIDVNMPGMNGIAVCRAIRAHATEHGRDCAVWMMTGGRTLEVEKAALEAGALVLLPKPFDYADLFRKFEERFGGEATSAPAAPV